MLPRLARLLLLALLIGAAAGAAAQAAPKAPGAGPAAPKAQAADATPSADAKPTAAPSRPLRPADAGVPQRPRRCTPYDVARASKVSGTGLTGNRHVVRDSRLADEGETWNGTRAVRLNDHNARLVMDMRLERELGYLVLQGDNNDHYRVEASTDGKRYKVIWNARPAKGGHGLRTRHVELKKKVKARYLRIGARRGDGYYSVSEVRAYCDKPKVWPPALTIPPPKTGWHAIDNPMMVNIKGGIAAAGVVVLLLFMWAEWRRRRERWLRYTRNTLLALIGCASFFSWWNLGHFHFDHYVHIWEHYHYFIGAKYGPELRYSHIYECTAQADIEDGLRRRVRGRKIRDLATDNQLRSTEPILQDPTRCKQHFSKDRWQQFRKDIRFFRGRFSRDRWDQSQSDHGYNATPVWAIAGRLIADETKLSWKAIEQIAWIDSVLLFVMWAAVFWAFGWQGACVALIYWGCNFPARFYWNGGSFLRYDWLFWMVIGLCLLKRERHFGAGLALTYATLLRVFPGFLVAALVLKVLYRMGKERRFVLSRAHAIFAAGCITAMAILIPASSWATDGLDAWQQFAENSEKHLSTALTNNMGLKTVLGYDFATRAKRMRNTELSDPFAEWKAARAHYYEISKPIMFVLVVLFCFLLARAGDRSEDWETACLGAGLVVMAVELTCYYYGFLLAYGLLWPRRKLPGLLAAALASATCWISHLPWNDDHFAGMSLASVVAVVVVTIHAAFAKSTERPQPTSPAPVELRR
ncbi:MAG: discoidin domain-containing protein [Myxococcales bacterium]|nr:discoidin domain-containing protein [Myxococcales bacterium]